MGELRKGWGGRLMGRCLIDRKGGFGGYEIGNGGWMGVF